ncbi:MAG: nucleoside recognition domain-containing protein, partial [Clostridia bacterium]
AFISDRLLSKIGLGGKSFVSMIVGCGCSVPAVMSTRTIKNINERNATIALVPFMPCSAKMAVISFFTAKLLGGNALIAASFYFLSIVCIILGGLILKVFGRRKTTAADTFLMELPTYRLPKLTNVLRQMWERGKAYIIKAGTIIFTASVVLWVLQSLNWRFQLVGADASMLSDIGKVIAPIFVPLGFGDWRFAVSALTGIVAKETVVTTLQILLGSVDIATVVSPLAAYSFVAYNLITIPCVATIAASFSELGSIKRGIKTILFQFVYAYVVALLIYQIGIVATTYTTIFVVTICVLAIAFMLYFCIRYIATHRGCNYECDHCPHNKDCTKDRNK